MNRVCTVAIIAVLSLVGRSTAEAPKFVWTKGQDLRYRVTQITASTDIVGDKRTENNTRLDLIKHWKVVEVDTAGVATLAMTLDRLRLETKAGDGNPTVFDSGDQARSNPAMREEMMKYVGPVVVTVRMNNRGQLVEVKESKFGPAHRLEADLPFKIVLPGTELTAGQGWERKFALHVEPVQGQDNEPTYDGLQNLTCKSINGPTAIIAFTNSITNPPESPAAQVPLLALQTSGEVTFDTVTGQVIKVKCQASRELKNHRGEGSKYQFANTYAEELMK